MLLLGQASWGLNSAVSESFPGEGSHLERYAARLGAVEINSSFYRPHQHKTYARWAASVPEDFRFCVKVPKSMTHEHALTAYQADLERFLGECLGLGSKLGALLVQMPPRLNFTAKSAEPFFSDLRARWNGSVVVEPRHASWQSEAAAALFHEFGLSPVHADPTPGGMQPWDETTGAVYYLRLHGSPVIYKSAYTDAALAGYAEALRRAMARGQHTWCVFDNTADGHALVDVLKMEQLLKGDPSHVQSQGAPHCAQRSPRSAL